MQRIEPRTATAVFPAHLLDHYFGIGKHVQCSGAKLKSQLQSFKKSSILGNVVVLMSDPLLDFDLLVSRTVDYHSNAGRTWIPERSAIDVGNEIRHVCDVCWNNNA